MIYRTNLSWFAFLYPFIFDIPAFKKEFEQLWECFKLKASSECVGPLPWLCPLKLLTPLFLLFLNDENNFCQRDCCTLRCCLFAAFVTVDVGILVKRDESATFWVKEEENFDCISLLSLHEGSDFVVNVVFLSGRNGDAIGTIPEFSFWFGEEHKLDGDICLAAVLLLTAGLVALCSMWPLLSFPRLMFPSNLRWLMLFVPWFVVYVTCCLVLGRCFGLELRLRRSDEVELLEYLSLPIPLVGILMALGGPGEPSWEPQEDRDKLLLCLW